MRHHAWKELAKPKSSDTTNLTTSSSPCLPLTMS